MTRREVCRRGTQLQHLLTDGVCVSAANQSDSERRGHGHVRVRCRHQEGHGPAAEGDAGLGKYWAVRSFSFLWCRTFRRSFPCIISFFSPLFLQSEFCGDKPKSGAKYGLPESLAILSEMGEVTDGVMDNKVKSLCFYLVHMPWKRLGDHTAIAA